MNILICNDDGVHAEGIKALYQELREKHQVTVVAPLEERSTTGHTLSLDEPLRIVKIEENIFGCSGYPADCSLVGFGHLLKYKPDIVVSGINRGANLGQDIYYSGTMAAAREASFHGIPGIAVSTACDFMNPNLSGVNYSTAAKFISDLLSQINLSDFEPLTVLNVNVPDCPQEHLKGIEMTELGFRKYSEEISERVDFKGRNYYWVGGVYEGYVGEGGTDCHAVDNNFISVTPLNLLGRKSEKLDNWSKLISSL
jgi:5'-nucleotidase